MMVQHVFDEIYSIWEDGPIERMYSKQQHVFPLCFQTPAIPLFVGWRTHPLGFGPHPSVILGQEGKSNLEEEETQSPEIDRQQSG